MKRQRDPLEKPQAAGNFAEFAELFEQLDAPPVFRLGLPAPDDQYLPKPRVGSCPAAHNRALIGKDIH